MKPSSDISRLIEIMAALRTPGSGCPWDLEQDFSTIAPYTIEEAYEVADAIQRGDMDDLREELGDLLLQVVFHARMAEEIGAFGFGEVVEAITRKMIRRHPHVFGDGKARDGTAIKEMWQKIKAEEKAERNAARRARGLDPQEEDGLLGGVPLAHPALMRAQKLQEKAGRAGFDWDGPGPVLDKVEEEIGELRAALADGSTEAVAEEYGDLLFALVNLGRHVQVDAETALRAANEKFRSRFRAVEAGLAAEGRTPGEASLQEMEALWQAAKRRERKQDPANG